MKAAVPACAATLMAAIAPLPVDAADQSANPERCEPIMLQGLTITGCPAEAVAEDQVAWYNRQVALHNLQSFQDAAYWRGDCKGSGFQIDDDALKRIEASWKQRALKAGATRPEINKAPRPDLFLQRKASIDAAKLRPTSLAEARAEAQNFVQNAAERCARLATDTILEGAITPDESSQAKAVRAATVEHWTWVFGQRFGAAAPSRIRQVEGGVYAEWWPHAKLPIVTDPDWLKAPTPAEMAAAAPPRLSGQEYAAVRLACLATPQGFMEDCHPMAEPDGRETTGAALRLVSLYKLPPADREGLPTPGRIVEFAVVFGSPPDL